MNEATTARLTAAECALRTGLTVRALRVYEDYGLISPGRSAGGWRIYGTEELLRLNEIGLLKVLGLTLTQIRDLTGRLTPPSLRQLLELQLGTLRQRRGEVERGLAAVDAALQHLHTSRSLSIEELCSLVRSLGMDASTGDISSSAAAEVTSLNQATLDRFAGYYRRHRALSVSTITRTDSKLFLEPIGQPAMELEPIGEAEFAIRTFDLVLRFEEIEAGAAKRMVIWQRGMMLKLARINAETAETFKHAIAERITSRTPMPGSEQAARQMIDIGRSGNPNYGLITPEFAKIVRAQLPYWQTVGQYFGAIVSIEFLGVSNQGWDLYRVQHEHDVQQYRIVLGDDGKVYGFGEASSEAERRALT
ncbi:MAG: MerR family transcriptional regulator [Steroidobacteraceae bacterium]